MMTRAANATGNVVYAYYLSVKAHFHFFILYGLLISLMYDWAEVYRGFQYLNLIAVVRYFYQGKRLEKNKLAIILGVPIGYMLLDMLAVGEFELASDVRHLWLATFVVLGVWCVTTQDLSWIKENYALAVFLLVCAYVIVQLLGFTLTDNPNGVMSNPHYLAFYSALALLISVGEILTRRGLSFYLFWLIVLALACFILYSSSRPAWLALILSCLVWPFFMPLRRAYLWVLLLPVVLFAGNFYNFSDRLVELAVNIDSEERVAIWAASVKMQLDSTWWEWLVGHGAESFLGDFMGYSEYHRQAMDFNSPHNSILEMLYISGIAGLVIFVAMYSWLFYHLITFTRRVVENKARMTLMVMALTFNFIMIFLTIPFFSPYNMYTLAYIAGVLLALNGKSIEAHYSHYSKL